MLNHIFPTFIITSHLCVSGLKNIGSGLCLIYSISRYECMVQCVPKVSCEFHYPACNNQHGCFFSVRTCIYSPQRMCTLILYALLNHLLMFLTTFGQTLIGNSTQNCFWFSHIGSTLNVNCTF